MEGWQNVVRILHLLGGVRAVNNPGTVVHLLPSLPGTQGAAYNISAYGNLFAQTRLLGLSVIGCDFITGPEQLSELEAPEWRLMMAPIGSLMWPSSDVYEIWANIGHEAAKQNKMSVFEKARHVSTQLDICIWRLHDLSDSHNRHLVSVCRSGHFKPGHGYAGSFSQLMFYSAHAMFSELASLRDHLAMFVAREVLGLLGQKIDSWPRLVEDRNFKTSAHPLAERLRNQGGWLDLFGEYRNLFVHNAPMGAAQGAAMVEHGLLRLVGGKEVPTVSLALPDDPAALRKRLRSEAALQSFDHWLEIAKERSSGPDVLKYCYETLTNMLHLAYEVSQHSPVPPVTPVITSADIIGKIKVTREIIPPLMVRIPPAPQKAK